MSTVSDRRERRETYEHVLGVVEHNTGGRQPAMARVTTVQQIACSNGYDSEQVQKAIQAAVENEDLIRWQDRDGRWRVARTDTDSLEAIVAEETQVEHTRVALQERCRELNQGDSA